jgi:Co/Zn/Cd efflux system component
VLRPLFAPIRKANKRAAVKSGAPAIANLADYTSVVLARDNRSAHRLLEHRTLAAPLRYRLRGNRDRRAGSRGRHAWHLALRGDHLDHRNDRDHDHYRRPKELNLRAAYIDLVAGAETSLLAIADLSLAWACGWRFSDPPVALNSHGGDRSWAWVCYAPQAGCWLMRPKIEAAVRDRIEQDGDRVTNFYLWQIGTGTSGLHRCSPIGRQRRSVCKARLAGISRLSDVTVEVELCPGQHPYLRRAA